MSTVCTDRHRAPIRGSLVALTLLGLLSACGDNGGDSGVGKGSSFTVSGSSNNTSSIIIELNPGAILYSIPANQTAWTIPVSVNEGSSYTVTVHRNPQSETCKVENGTFRVTTDITNVAIVCTPTPYAIGGMVSGFTGSGLVLEDSVSGHRYTVTGNGRFVVDSLTTGTNYNIIADTSKTKPFLSCQIPNGTGIVNNFPVTGIIVTCSVLSFSVGGSISGLQGSNLVITVGLPGQPPITPPPGATTFAFPNIPSGSTYNIQVQNPTHTSTGLAQTCSVTNPNANNTVAASSINNIQITCSTNTYQVSGTIVLPEGETSTPAGLFLTETVSGQPATINPASPNPKGYLASFSFPAVLDGSSFNISIKELQSENDVSSNLHCIVDGAGATGVITGGPNSSVVVKCRYISSFLASAGYETVTQGAPPATIQQGAVDCFAIDHIFGGLQLFGTDGVVQNFAPIALVAGTSVDNYSVPVLHSDFFYAYVDYVDGQYYIQTRDATNGSESYYCFDEQATQLTQLATSPSVLTPGVLAFDPSEGGTLYAALGFNFVEVQGVTDLNGVQPTPSVQYSQIHTQVPHENFNPYPASSLQFDGTNSNGTYSNALVFYATPASTFNDGVTPLGINEFEVLNNSSGSWTQIPDSAALTSGGFAGFQQEGLTPVSSLAIGDNIYVLASNLTFCFLVECYGQAPASPPRIVGYSLNAASGALTALGTFQDPNAPNDFGASLVSYCYDPSNLAVSQNCDNSTNNLVFLVGQSTGIDVFQQQTPSGALKLLTTTGPVAANGVEGISSVVIDPSGKFLYAAATVSSNVVAYRINPTANSANLLTVIGTYAVSGVNAMVMDSSGKFLYVLGSQLSGFLVDPNTGVLTPTPGSPYAASGTYETLLAISAQ